MRTELGRIAGLLQQAPKEPTPLQRRLAELGKVLTGVVAVVVAVVFVLESARGGELMEVLLLAISLGVAAVPEGLPAVVTIVLALGLQRLARRQALIRKLPSVETLGSVTVICSDKTGTLTRNEMTVREVVLADRHYEVTGVGYEPHGAFLRLPERHNVAAQSDPVLNQALLAAARCNNAELISRPDGGWTVVGDPTEGALLVVAAKADIDVHAPRDILLEVPFDSERKMMSVVVRESSGEPFVYVKGAPEVVLPRCTHWLRDHGPEPLASSDRDRLVHINAEMASRALRVLAVAYRIAEVADSLDLERDLVFLALVGMMDPPRPEVYDAVRTCGTAGIRPVMITGDHPGTAWAIGQELGLAATQEEVLTGTQLDSLTDAALCQHVERIRIYARTNAEHKLRVVRAWKKRGAVVAMTGDGVNDAPAIREADIGIAMGRTGTDVTREAADMVLLDDNFATIVNAVEEGRAIYANVEKVVHYLLACNASEVLLIFLAGLLGLPRPVSATQILWINLITDGLPALALGVEPPEPDLMQRPPRPAREPVLSRQRGLRILAHGMLLAFCCLGVSVTLLYGLSLSPEQAQVGTFCTVAFSQLTFSLACRSHTRVMPQLGLFSNRHLLLAMLGSAVLQAAVVSLPGVRYLFDAQYPLSATAWAVIVGLSLLPVTIVEVAKILRKRAEPRRQPRQSSTHTSCTDTDLPLG